MLAQQRNGFLAYFVSVTDGLQDCLEVRSLIATFQW